MPDAESWLGLLRNVAVDPIRLDSGDFASFFGSGLTVRKRDSSCQVPGRSNPPGVFTPGYYVPAPLGLEARSHETRCAKLVAGCLVR